MGHWLGIEGQVAVVTGAAGGIGKGIAAALAEAGARVWVLDRDRTACEAAAAEVGGRGLAFDAADLPAPASRPRPRRSARRHPGQQRRHPARRPAGRYHGAGLGPGAAHQPHRLPRLRPGLRRRHARAGAGCWCMSRRSRPASRRPSRGAYSASKAAVAMLSRGSPSSGARMACGRSLVSPGMIRTPLSEDFYRVPGILEAREAVVPACCIWAPADIAQRGGLPRQPRAPPTSAARTSSAPAASRRR